MYEELLNFLLYDAGWLEQGMTQTERDIAEHLKKAADAIEELSKRVPPVPHGRLIDADALLDDLLFPSKQFEQGMKELIGDAPTIIPAEEEELCQQSE